MTTAAIHRRTLLLSQAYEPIQAISLKKALTLISKGRVEVLEEYDWNLLPAPAQFEAEQVTDHGGVKQIIKRTLVVFKAPAVVRLLRSFRRPKRRVKFSRLNVFARDNYTCQYCAAPMKIAELTWDHVVPRSRGGLTTWENLVTACYECNTVKKRGRTPDEAGMRLLSKPHQPKWEPALVIEVSRKSVPDAWRDYLYWTSELENDNTK